MLWLRRRLRQVLEHGEQMPQKSFRCTFHVFALYVRSTPGCCVCFSGHGGCRWDVQRASTWRGVVPREGAHHFTGIHLIFFLLSEITLAKVRSKWRTFWGSWAANFLSMQPWGFHSSDVTEEPPSCFTASSFFFTEEKKSGILFISHIAQP